jgi:hypothetical protein
MPNTLCSLEVCCMYCHSSNFVKAHCALTWFNRIRVVYCNHTIWHDLLVMLYLKVRPEDHSQSWPGLSRDIFLDAPQPGPLWVFIKLCLGGALSSVSQEHDTAIHLIVLVSCSVMVYRSGALILVNFIHPDEKVTSMPYFYSVLTRYDRETNCLMVGQGTIIGCPYLALGS